MPNGMITTEEKAAGKRCCGPEGCGRTVRDRVDDARYCIGSQCMAWREVFTGNVDNPPPHPAGAGYSRRIIGGYCGLAGAPE